MKRAAIPAIFALGLALSILATLSHNAFAQHTSPSCKYNCTFTGTTTAAKVVTTDATEGVSIPTNSKLNLSGSGGSGATLLWDTANLQINKTVLVQSGTQIEWNGSLSRLKGINNSVVEILSSVSDGASAVGVRSNTANTLSNAAAKIHSFQNNGSEKAYVDLNGVVSTGGLLCSGSTHCGTITLPAATSGTATVVSGCHPLCTNTTSTTAVKCSVASTTLTAAEASSSSDAINYFCF